ncbi:MAG TPA: P-loop NTPase, partial [Polyangiaceae bacterium]
MATLKEQVEKILATVAHPTLGKPITDLGMVGEVTTEEGHATVTVKNDGGAGHVREKLGHAIRVAVSAVAGVTLVEVKWDEAVPSRDIAAGDPMPSVRNVVLVMSGKGGVGKSTTATNLTMALHRMGLRVGLLDADIYGPSIPTMLGVSGRPVSLGGKTIEPLTRFGVKLMSIR